MATEEKVAKAPAEPASQQVRKAAAFASTTITTSDGVPLPGHVCTIPLAEAEDLRSRGLVEFV